MRRRDRRHRETGARIAGRSAANTGLSSTPKKARRGAVHGPGHGKARQRVAADASNDPVHRPAMADASLGNHDGDEDFVLRAIGLEQAVEEIGRGKPAVTPPGQR